MNEIEIIKAYEEYVGILGEELKDVTTIASQHGYSSKRLKEISRLRNKIVNLKEI